MGKRRWADFYPGGIALALALPVAMMGGVVRPPIAAGLALLGAYLLTKAWKKSTPAAAG